MKRKTNISKKPDCDKRKDSGAIILELCETAASNLTEADAIQKGQGLATVHFLIRKLLEEISRRGIVDSMIIEDIIFIIEDYICNVSLGSCRDYPSVMQNIEDTGIFEDEFFHGGNCTDYCPEIYY